MQFKQWMRLGVISSMITAGLYVFAVSQRKVSIVNQEATYLSGVELINGSSVPVTYSISCYNKAGTTLFSKSSQTLGSKAKITHAKLEYCGNNISPTIGAGGYSGAVYCNYSNQYSNAATSCGSAYTVCSYNDYVNKYGINSSYQGWIQAPTASMTSSSNTYGIRYSSPGSFSTNSNDHIPIAASSDYYCNSAIDGSGSTYQGCYQYYIYNSLGAYCCAKSSTESPAASCDVTIESSTAAEGYLQSPQFKGGSAF